MKPTRPWKVVSIGEQIIYQAYAAHAINHNKHLLYLFYTRWITYAINLYRTFSDITNCYNSYASIVYTDT